ncbi:ubiquitin carboxyl-terminal hydrolase MINDY-3 homolog [Drosophila madeirensis]|uniref:Ubiquitin carboxyl-terminal hydrolase MINDY n=1 Tax=Drosophila madeirensis TaxID=30013 RepID=A0AAU9G0A1_DROMD
MNEETVGEPSEKSASQKTASASTSMTLASAALEPNDTATAAGQQQQEQRPTTSAGPPTTSAAHHQQQQQQASSTPDGGPQTPKQKPQQQQQQLPPMPQLNANDMRELREIKQLLWGDNVREDVFKRWSQGFEFSDYEPSALVQKQGGPCAVIAPVQAYLLKIITMDTHEFRLSEITPAECKRLLIQALCNILRNCRAPRYRLVQLHRHRISGDNQATKERATTSGTAAAAAAAAGAGAGAGAGPNANEVDEEAEEATPETVDHLTGKDNKGGQDSSEHHPDRDLTPEEFHARLYTLHFLDGPTVARYFGDHYNQLTDTYGVMLFMYSVFLTKGIELVAADISDTSEPIIHRTFGYGGQSMINLMLTGRAVGYVWDHEQDVGGLKLRGICEQSDIGYITTMEQMRYCTVGSFYKNPRYPVWVMGSDTHLTVLFSHEKKLVSPETPSEHGRRVFKSYDPEGNNFIASSLLREVLAQLNLVSEQGYVNLMMKRLDPENLGIILLNAFMEEFFPCERHSAPDTFELMHYNGIPGSNDNNKVRYYCGSAILLEGDLKSICASNPMVTCLQTKWPNIEINWHDPWHTPSLN